MVRVIILLVMYFVSQFINAQTLHEKEDSDAGISISVNIPNVSNNEGEVIAALYDCNESFMSRTPIVSKKSKIIDGKVSITFENVTPGEYAVVCLHDKNLNGRMDFTDNGMPVEDYGSSNNVYRMGPPLFDDAKFTVENKSLDLTIKF